MKNILKDIKISSDNFTAVLNEINILSKNYQKGKLDYMTYNDTAKKILGGKTKEDIFIHYKNYQSSLKDRFLLLNNDIIKATDRDKSYEILRKGTKPAKKEATLSLPPISDIELEAREVLDMIPEEELIEKPKKIIADQKPDREFLEKPKKIFADQKPDKDYIEIVKEKYVVPETYSNPPEEPEELSAPIEELKAEDSLKAEILPPGDIPVSYEPDKTVELGQQKTAPSVPKPNTLDKNIQMGGLLSKNLLKRVLSKEKKTKKKMDFGKTEILPSVLTFEGSISKKDAISKKDILDPYLLEKQIKELKSLISRKKPEVYKANTLGYLANMTVRKISIYFIEKYPGIFRNIYREVRHANIKIMANTYINIIFFITLLSLIISFPILTVIFGLQGGSILVVFTRTILSSFGLGCLTFFLCSYYPTVQSKARVRSINTNLPFAIDHMASVISSGVTPATMFKLISNSSEYGEISIEIEKVSSYVEFFGYDVLTALKAVALSTPSQQFKEFLDGFISTIETGGDLRDYLSQKSSEALLNYRLERQKYVESLSTYSDIYTGLLIAAPLFFVTTLALVAAFNGNIGGISINTIIVLGTYIVIPVLNILFLVFLELNQPEI
ncbi:MAG: type II secretion system F family protein [archaeon]